MKPRINKKMFLSTLAILAVLIQLGCSSNQTSSSNSSTAAKQGSETARDNANQPGNANAPEQSAASESPAVGGRPPAAEAPSPAGPPTGATVPAGSAPASEQAGAPQPPAPAPPPPPPPPRTYTLASGRSLPVYTTSTLSTKSNKSGEPFTCTLATAIVDGDWVIAQRGATVEGVIVDSDPGGRVKGVASISVRLKRLTLADGRTTPISTTAYVTKARTTKKKDVKKIGIGAGAGAVIGAIAGGGKGAAIGAGVGGGAGTAVVLGTRGDPAVIPGESKLSFRLTSAVKITQR